MKIFKKLITFIIEVKTELKKVSWSSKEEIIGSTWVVVVSVFLLAVFIGMIDLVLSKFVGLIIR
jgi:preprotein translocase subunit SecE